jgi:hypothetical protein
MKDGMKFVEAIPSLGVRSSPALQIQRGMDQWRRVVKERGISLD